LHSEFWDARRIDPAEVKGNRYGISAVELTAERKNRINKQFDAVLDTKIREIMRLMITAEFPPKSAQYIAKKTGYAFPQFVIDFNRGLAEIIEIGK